MMETMVERETVTETDRERDARERKAHKSDQNNAQKRPILKKGKSKNLEEIS